MATIDDLQELFQLQAETLATEFKSWLDLNTPAGRAPLAKAAIALANHGGGTILIGMREAANGPIGSHARPDGMKRYTVDDVNAAVNRYADPHLHCDVVHLAHPVTGNEHAFIVVPGGHAIPIMASRGTDGEIQSQKVYIRKAGPKSEEPFTADEWRALMNRCVQNGRDALLDNIRIILSGSALTPAVAPDKLLEFVEESRARFQQRVMVLPPDAPERHLLGSYECAFEIQGVPAVGLAELSRKLEKASSEKLTGWGPFVNLTRAPIAPVPANGAIEAWLGNPKDGVSDARHADFWRASPDGRLYLLRAIDEDYHSKLQPGKALEITLPIWRVGETILFVSRLAKEWADDPRISIRIEYAGLEGRVLGAYLGTRSGMNSRVCHTDKIVLQGEATAKEIAENTVEVLHPLLKPLYELFEFYEIPVNFIVEELDNMRQRKF